MTSNRMGRPVRHWMRAARLAAVAEWRERGRMTIGLGAVAAVAAIGIAQSAGPRDPRATELLLALVPTFAAATAPAGVVDEAALFLRLVRTQPLPRGAYVALKALATSALLLAVTAPLVLAAALLEGAPLAPVAAALALVVLWSAAATTLLGLAMHGPGAATAVWVVICLANLLAVLASGPSPRMDDMLVRLRHALPGPGALEVTMRGYDPWRLGGALVLAIEGAVLALAAGLRSWSARGSVALGVVGAVALPFVLPARGGA